MLYLDLRCYLVSGILFLLFVKKCHMQLSKDRNELLNWCLDSKYHKSSPGKEDQLHDLCIPWKERSCCTHETTVDIHTGKLYNFDFDHCKYKINRKMSSKCKQHFVRDHCFYECSPNVGPWAVKVEKKTRNETFVNVPLCESDCISWFDACKNDYTCTNNWSQNFNWINGSNKCPKNAKCQTFKSVFKSAKYFCETVWDKAWKVVSDKEPCMRIWPDTINGNPNEDIAKLRVKELLGSAYSFSAHRGLVTLIIFVYYLLK